MINGLFVDDSNHPATYSGGSVFGNPNAKNTGPDYVESYPYAVTERLSMKNVTTASGQPLKTDLNAWMFRNLQVSDATADIDFTVGEVMPVGGRVVHAFPSSDAAGRHGGAGLLFAARVGDARLRRGRSRFRDVGPHVQDQADGRGGPVLPAEDHRQVKVAADEKVVAGCRAPRANFLV